MFLGQKLFLLDSSFRVQFHSLFYLNLETTMKSRSLFLSCILLTGAITPVISLYQVQPASARTSSRESLATKVYTNSFSSIVRIETADKVGSGFIIEFGGKNLILMNAHEVTNSPTITVTLSDGQKLQGKVVASDSSIDLALAEVEGIENMKAMKFAKPKQRQIGQNVFAIGHPRGLPTTLTQGIISQIYPEQGLIQTDAGINPGNSGGPLLNADAEVEGVVVSILPDTEGIAFVIDVNRVQGFLSKAQEQGCLDENEAGGKMCTIPVSEQQSPIPIGEEQQEPVPFGESKFIYRIDLKDSVISNKLDRESLLLPNNAYAKSFIFQGKAGQKITFDMESADLDPVMFLASMSQPDQPLGFDGKDNDGRGGNAHISVTLPQDGTYILLVSSYQAQSVGDFTLRISEVP
jgi:S1-C subfamily serine protease